MLQQADASPTPNKAHPWWQDWCGEACAIIASGPSAKAANVEQLRGRIKVFAIKESAVTLCPWADVVYGCDLHWWIHRRGLPTFNGLKLAWHDGVSQRFPDVKRIVIKDKMLDRLLTDQPGVVGSGGNSGFQALNIAVQFGAARILLVGFDMHGNGGLHWYGRNNWAKGNNPSESNFRRWRKALEGSAPVLADLGIEVLNASPLSALKTFRRATVAEALEMWGL